MVWPSVVVSSCFRGGDHYVGREKCTRMEMECVNWAFEKARLAELLSLGTPLVPLLSCLLGLEQSPQKTQPISCLGVQAWLWVLTGRVGGGPHIYIDPFIPFFHTSSLPQILIRKEKWFLRIHVRRKLPLRWNSKVWLVYLWRCLSANFYLWWQRGFSTDQHDFDFDMLWACPRLPLCLCWEVWSPDRPHCWFLGQRTFCWWLEALN